MATLMMAVLFGSCSSDDGFDYIAESSGIMTRGVSDDDMVKMRLEVRYDSAVTRNKRFVKFFYIKLRDPNTNDSCIAYASLDDHTHNFWDHHTPFDRGVLIPKRWQNLKEGEYWEIEANVEVFPYYDGDLKISLYNLGVETTWQIDPAHLVLKEQGEEGIIIVGLYPNQTDTYTMNLWLCIKDNPIPMKIGFKAVSSNPHIDFSQNMIDFGRVLIKNRASQEITFSNKGTFPVAWSLKHGNQFPPSCPFSISKNDGILAPRKSEVVEFGFYSAKPINAKKAIVFDFQDKEKTRLFGTGTVNLIGEAFDSNYDIVYPPKTNSLAFGVLKVGQTKNIQVSLKCKGKYPSQYSLTIPKRLAQYLKCNVKEGTIPAGDKVIQMTFTFCANKVTSFNNVKACTISIIDQGTGLETYKNDLIMQASTIFSSYEVDPEFDFGSIQVNSNKSGILQLKNTGPFPLEYNLTMKPAPPKEKIVKGKKVPVKPPPSPKPKMRKGQGMQIQIGPFVVCPCQGVVQPNTTQNISVEITHNVVEKLESIAILKTSDSDPNKESITEIPIRADVVSPALFNSDYEPIFEGLHLCLRSDLQKNNVTAFLEDEHMIHFCPSMLGTEQSVMMRVINPPPIPITVDVSLKGAKGKNISSAPFDTEVPIKFAPSTEGQFSTFIEANVRGCTNPKLKQLRFAIEGFGTLPTVTTEKMKSIPLGRVLVGSSRERTVVIRNDGYIPAHVVITTKTSLGFSLKDPDTLEYDINPGRQQLITVVFAPQKVQKVSYEVTASVADNPKCSLSFNFVGEGFLDDVIFESSQQPLEDCDVSFATVVGRKAEITFITRNISQKDIRFAFPVHQSFTFLPRVGHIRAGRHKEIKMEFYTDKPVKLTGVKLPVQWAKIEIPDGTPDWDDSIRSTLFDTEGKKIVKVQEEPQVKIIPPKLKDLTLRVTAISDVIKYTIDTKDIEFSPTMMYQSRFVEIKMTNTSLIKFEYSWELERFSALRTDYARVRKPCFSVTPSTGTIPGGASKIFRVRFSPEEVDDFTAEYKCKIPFLVQLPAPLLQVSGISRRPLCHFNVETSDYLTRRHPAYSDIPLPDDVTVIEIFSKKAGIKTIKKFEIVNPTSLPYEVKWTKVDDSTAIKALNPSALISSGKRYSFAFEYSPVSNKTVESLWTFAIPVHKITRHILFVGKIVPE